MNQKFEQLKPYLENWAALQAALQLFGWDMETLAPEGAGKRTSLVFGVLSDRLREETLKPETKAIVRELLKDETLSDAERSIAKKIQKDIDDLELIPADEYRAFTELQSTATTIWAKAREEKNFDLFAPILEEILRYTRKFAGYKAKEGQALYDVLLEDFEKGFPMAVLDPFFDQLKETILPLLQKTKERADQIQDDFLFGHFDIDAQKEFNDYILDYLGFDRSRGVVAESAHPFTTNLHKDDVRITTHYYEELLTSAIFSSIHECGHALYEFDIADELSQTPAGGGASCGMHESQSRFFENMVGRSLSFWKPVYPKLQSLFPEQLKDVSCEKFVAAINKAVPSLVRTESDELTYCLHIMIRYELEKQLMDGSLAITDLPAAWDDLYEKYLGVRPANVAEGVLQDIHWSQGSIGYFPSYALGNAYGAQIAHRMAEDMDIDALLEQGNVSVITDWLHEHIHRFGAVYDARDLLMKVTGEDFNPKYYFEYLQRKFG